MNEDDNYDDCDDDEYYDVYGERIKKQLYMETVRISSSLTITMIIKQARKCSRNQFQTWRHWHKDRDGAEEGEAGVEARNEVKKRSIDIYTLLNTQSNRNNNMIEWTGYERRQIGEQI